MRAIPSMAVTFVAKHEGCRLEAYPDPATGGEPWTIGYGHTRGVKRGDKITAAKAKALLKEDLEAAAMALTAKVGPVVPALTENQYAALLSFVFNVGTGDPKKREWTIWKRLRARQFDQVPLELIKFVNADGRKLRGLVHRRAEEVKLWSLDEPGSADEHPPSSVTRAIATPPTPADPAPPSRSATFLTGAIGATATVPVAAKSITDAVEPYKEAAPVVGQAIAVIAAIAAAAAVLTLVLTWLKTREARG